MASLVWILTGIILFGGMIAGTIRLWIKRRREPMQTDPFGDQQTQPDKD